MESDGNDSAKWSAKSATKQYKATKRHFGNKADFAAMLRVMSWIVTTGMCAPSTNFLVGGVNYGQLSRTALQRCGDLAFHGFEVQGDLIANTSSNLSAIGSHVHLHHLGWSDAETMNVTVTGKSGAGFSGLYRATGRWAHLHPLGRAHLHPLGSVSTVTLSDWADRHHIDTITYLVIDVEGHEPKVIRGMKLEQPRNQRRFPLFQYELGGTWAEKDARHGNDLWTQQATALHLTEHGYWLYLIGEFHWLRIFPETFTQVEMGTSGNAKNGFFLQGNCLALHPVHARSFLTHNSTRPYFMPQPKQNA